MYRAPARPQRSPGAPPPTDRYPSPGSCWGFPGAGPPCGPAYSPGSHRGYSGGSPSGFGSVARGFVDSPSGFGSESRGFGGPRRHRGAGSRRPPSFSPSNLQGEASVEKYFSPSMLQDPWEALQPAAARQTS